MSYQGIDRAIYVCRPASLKRAVTNFVENGTKYSSEVVVGLQCLESEIRIEISDNGPGISPDIKEKVFKPFFKGDLSRSGLNRTGFGLGLSIARDIIQSHGGQIDLRDRKPHGLRVLIKLPNKPRISS